MDDCLGTTSCPFLSLPLEHTHTPQTEGKLVVCYYTPTQMTKVVVMVAIWTRVEILLLMAPRKGWKANCLLFSAVKKTIINIQLQPSCFMPVSFAYIIRSFHLTTIWDKLLQYLHFTAEEAEAQRGHTCSNWWSQDLNNIITNIQVWVSALHQVLVRHFTCINSFSPQNNQEIGTVIITISLLNSWGK